MRPTEAVVDLGAVAQNIERLVGLASPADVCAVVKADAYGHGSVQCARVALAAGANWLAVALVEEGMTLREAGIDAPILVLSEPLLDDMADVVTAGLTPTVYTPKGIAAISAAASSSVRDDGVAVHLGLNTGMNRVGLHPDMALDAVRSIADAPGIRLGGVWTHLAVADEPDRPETAQQLQRFHAVLSAIGPELPADVIVHAANSAGLLAHPDATFDMVRAGISAYGIEPAAGVGTAAGLTPALSLRTELSLVKRVPAGEAVSYGLRYVVETDTTIGTLPIGYADGLRRDAHRNGTDVLVGGRRCPIVGVVTMDQTMIDLGPDSEAEPGDDVVLIGTQGSSSITVAEIAERRDTIPYEVVCSIGQRVRRRFV